MSRSVFLHQPPVTHNATARPISATIKATMRAPIASLRLLLCVATFGHLAVTSAHAKPAVTCTEDTRSVMVWHDAKRKESKVYCRADLKDNSEPLAVPGKCTIEPRGGTGWAIPTSPDGVTILQCALNGRGQCVPVCD